MHEKPLSYSFPAVVSSTSRILILGSMPGVISLQQQQYYAHPRNAFWSIMAEVVGFDRNADYTERCNQLIKSDIAVWDVLKACYRPGSLDQHIDATTIEANDFVCFLKQYPSISHLFFNGSKAEQVFKRYILKGHENDFAYLHMQRLPSTSPAHAAVRPEQKTEIWIEALKLAVEASD